MLVSPSDASLFNILKKIQNLEIQHLTIQNIGSTYLIEIISDDEINDALKRFDLIYDVQSLMHVKLWMETTESLNYLFKIMHRAKLKIKKIVVKQKDLFIDTENNNSFERIFKEFLIRDEYD